MTTQEFKDWAKVQHLDTLRELVACKDSWYYEEHDEEMLREAVAKLLASGVVGSQFYGPDQCIEELSGALEAAGREFDTPYLYVAFLRQYDPS